MQLNTVETYTFLLLVLHMSH